MRPGSDKQSSNKQGSNKQLASILVICLVAACCSLASADSLQLRNGRHLQGKYVGGSTTMVGFMTSGAVEYFQTSDVLALMFDSNVDPALNGLQPNHLNGSPAQMAFQGTAQRTSVRSGRNKKPHSKLRKVNIPSRYVTD
jgi:hypothetical protein